MDVREYLAGMASLFIIFVIVWYITSNNWMPSGYLGPIGQLLGFCALILTAIFVVSQIRGDD